MKFVKTITVQMQSSIMQLSYLLDTYFSQYFPWPANSNQVQLHSVWSYKDQCKKTNGLVLKIWGNLPRFWSLISDDGDSCWSLFCWEKSYPLIDEKIQFKKLPITKIIKFFFVPVQAVCLRIYKGLV